MKRYLATLLFTGALIACPGDTEAPTAAGGAAGIAGSTSGGEAGAGGSGGAAGRGGGEAGAGGTGAMGGQGGEGGGMLWNCALANYGAMDGCHCGCGIVDPDCADATAASCDVCGLDEYGRFYGSCAKGECPGNVDPTNNAICLPPVCGNDLVDTDEDCDDGNLMPKDGCDPSCHFEPPPPGWDCHDLTWNDASCWCGCGLVDPGCASPAVTSCTNCPLGCAEGTCSSIEPADNKTCIGCGDGIVDPGEDCDDANDAPGDGCLANCKRSAPYHWTCSPHYYDASDGCDCGCGAIDPDCADATAASCAYCTDPGSCVAGLCPGNIAAADNATCTGCGNGVLDAGEQCDDSNTLPYDGCSPNCFVELYPPPEWSCLPSYYNAADGCDCGCGAVDPDCTDATASSCAFCQVPGSCGTGACPAEIDPVNNALCL